VGGLVLFDAAYLAVVLATTGGAHSPLSFLVLVHVITVTLLLSFRYGLTASLWHALLMFLSSWLAQAGVIVSHPATNPEQATVLGALALLVVAVVTAWFSALNEGELRRGKAEMRALADMASRMAATRDQSVLVEALLTGVAEAFGRQRSAVVLADATTGTSAAFAVRPDGSVGAVAAGDAAAAVARHTAAAGFSLGPVLLRSLDDRLDSLLVAALPGAANVMVAPLVVDGQPIGTLAVERGGGAKVRVTARAVDLLAQFAAHGALALRAAALQAEVERIARTDALTGLANRRAFGEALARELAVAARGGATCALIVLDIDHFKAVNDTYGHPAGDRVLAAVGRVLALGAREIDVPARYGGEEFAVILPGCDGSDALDVAERLRAAVAAEPGPVQVTISAGVAVFPADGAEADSLVAAADSALYRAKRQGRNRTVRFRRPRRLTTATAS
jgi:diguanylate cyclase (GGDEF)-like protein